MILASCICNFFFFNDTATTEIYTLSLHDALPILTAAIVQVQSRKNMAKAISYAEITKGGTVRDADRKSTRLNSSHDQISYAVFCLKKKIIQWQPATFRNIPTDAPMFESSKSLSDH